MFGRISMVSVGLVQFFGALALGELTYHQPHESDLLGLSKTSLFATPNAADFSPQLLVSQSHAQVQNENVAVLWDFETDVSDAPEFSGFDLLSGDLISPSDHQGLVKPMNGDLFDGWSRYAETITPSLWLADSHQPTPPPASAFVARYDPHTHADDLVPSVSVIPLPSPIVGGLVTLGMVLAPALLRRFRITFGS